MGGGKRRSSSGRRGSGQSRKVFVGGGLLDDWNRPSLSPASSTPPVSGKKGNSRGIGRGRDNGIFSSNEGSGCTYASFAYTYPEQLPVDSKIDLGDSGETSQIAASVYPTPSAVCSTHEIPCYDYDSSVARGRHLGLGFHDDKNENVFGSEGKEEYVLAMEEDETEGVEEKNETEGVEVEIGETSMMTSVCPQILVSPHRRFTCTTSKPSNSWPSRSLSPPRETTNRGPAMGSDVQRGVVLSASDNNVSEAIRAIQDSRVISVPTDTLYGFSCDACCKEAVSRIYEIKGRRHTSPLAICVGDVADISHYAFADHLPTGLLQSLLPGPVTVVLKRGNTSILDKSLNPGMDSIAIRVPDSDFIRQVARGCGTALALTSANLSGQPSSVSINDFDSLWHHCAFVFDDGLLPSGPTGSTIVDLITPGKYKILRPGSAEEGTVAILRRFNLVEEEKEGGGECLTKVLK